MTLALPTVQDLIKAQHQLDVVRLQLEDHKLKSRAQNELRCRFSNAPEIIKTIVSVLLHNERMDDQEYLDHLNKKLAHVTGLIAHFSAGK